MVGLIVTPFHLKYRPVEWKRAIDGTLVLKALKKGLAVGNAKHYVYKVIITKSQYQVLLIRQVNFNLV